MVDFESTIHLYRSIVPGRYNFTSIGFGGCVEFRRDIVVYWRLKQDKNFVRDLRLVVEGSEDGLGLWVSSSDVGPESSGGVGCGRGIKEEWDVGGL